MPDIRCGTDNLHGPQGELASRVLAMPSDTNPKGDVFGGWIMSLMDMVGKMSATTAANGRVVTVAVERIVFRAPVNVGDVVCCYTNILRTGRSSITLSIEVWTLRQGQGERVKVTDAIFTFVAVDETGRPRPLASQPQGGHMLSSRARRGRSARDALGAR